MSVEEFFKAHQYTVAALGVLGTFLAVVVALSTALVAIRASRTRISARASINLIHHASMQGGEPPRYLVVYIRNLGTMPVHIPMGCFHWKLPFRRDLFEVLAMDFSASDRWVPQKKYPLEIKARSSEVLFLSPMDMFRDYAMKDFVGTSFFSRLRSRFLSAFIFTDEGKTFKVKFDSSLRKELARLREHRDQVHH